MTRKRFIDKTTPPHLFTLIFIAGLGGASMNLYLPSMPNMAVFFSTPSSVVQLTVAVYLAASAILQLVVGPLSDRYGRRPVMLACFAIYLVGTVMCIYAEHISLLILGRVVQSAAVGGAVLSRAIVRDLFEANKAASMLGYVTMGLALGPMVAPVIGGFVDDQLGWQANFVGMFVLGTLALFLVYVNLGETNRSEFSSLKKQFGQYPRLLKSRRFWGYTSTATFCIGTFFAFLGGAPFVAMHVFGLSPTQYGVYFMIISLGYIGGNFLSGRFAIKIGINRMIFAGTLTATLGLFVGIGLLMAGINHPLSLFGPTLIVGIGNGLTMPSATAGLVSVRPELAGTASGLGGSMQMGGGAALSAIAGFLVTTYNSPLSLMIFMACTSSISIVAGLYAAHIDRQAREISTAL